MGNSKYSKQVSGVLRGMWLKLWDAEIAREGIKESKLVAFVVAKYLQNRK